MGTKRKICISGPFFIEKQSESKMNENSSQSRKDLEEMEGYFLYQSTTDVKVKVLEIIIHQILISMQLRFMNSLKIRYNMLLDNIYSCFPLFSCILNFEFSDNTRAHIPKGLKFCEAV